MSKVLDHQEIEVVRAKYIKEMAVTEGRAGDLKREITFGSETATLGEVQEWLSKKGRFNSCLTLITGIAAVVAAIAAVAAAVLPFLVRPA